LSQGEIGPEEANSHGNDEKRSHYARRCGQRQVEPPAADTDSERD
jgi:hypothetical protein